MFKSVLVGVEGRPNGRDAIALVTRLGDAGGKLTLAHVHYGEASEDLEDSHKLLGDDTRTAPTGAASGDQPLEAAGAASGA